MRTAFLGTPEAAVPSLEALTRISQIEVVVTRPDRPRGRSRRLQPPPVKVAAQEMGLPVAQPATGRELAICLAGHDLEVGVVVAFGMILRPDVLALPSRGFVNVHFSLLPRWRGAAPVERAMMVGDDVTGVSLMLMDEGLDTGPVIAQAETPILPQESGGDLRRRLADMGADLLGEALPDWVEEKIEPRPQPGESATYASKLEPADRDLSPGMSVGAFTNRVRALAPLPGARLSIGGEPHKILRVDPSTLRTRAGVWLEGPAGVPVLGVADGAVAIEELQAPGKRPMAGADWLRGRDLPSPFPMGR
ncbi:MAG TPA: methionyl-tRNA formyltransferase [Acidimicrobiia bacterium]|nr:methionyl-tRNA formyltransferase [Acidimicrobiia bacterium]